MIASASTILVTGATGNVGRHVVRALKARGVPVRAAVFSAERARGVLGEDIDLVELDFEDPATFARASTGARGLFLLRPPHLARVATTLNPFIDVAQRQGVEHVVFLSVAGAEKNRFVPHRAVEAHLQACGVASTLLRPGFFAQNLGDAYRQDIRDDDRLFVPAGRGRAAFVDVRDVAEVAADAFLDGRHRGQAYTLTGREALDFDQVAARLTEALGRPIHYARPSALAYVRHLRRRRLPAGQIAVQTALHLLLRTGNGARVDPTLERLLGRPPTSLATYIRDHVALWRPSTLS